MTGIQNVIWQIYWQGKCLEIVPHHFEGSTQ